MATGNHVPTLTQFAFFCKFSVVFILALTILGCHQFGQNTYNLPAQSPLERSPSLAVFNIMYSKVLSVPTLNSNVVFLARGGDIVTILGRSMERELLGGVLDYWYRVDFSGRTGWVFASALRFCSDPIEARYVSERIQKAEFP